MLKYRSIKLSLLASWLCLFFALVMQTPVNAQDNFDRRQFSIMVVPYIKVSENASYIKNIEGSSVIRNAISIINKALLKADYKVEDYLEQYVIDKRKGLIDGSEKDVSEIIIKNAPVDVYFKFEIDLRRCSSPDECEMKVRLQAVDKYNSTVYADCILSSQCRRACDSAMLLNSVLEFQDGGASACIIEQFDREYRKVLQRDGRTMEVEIGIKEGCSRRLNEDCDTEKNQIKDCAEDYIKTLAKNGKSQIIGSTDKILRVRFMIELTDSPTLTSRKIRQFLLKMNPPKGAFDVEEVVMRAQSTISIKDKE